MKPTAIVFFLGLLRADAFVPPSTKRTDATLSASTTLADFFTTLDTSTLSLTSPGLKEFVLLMTPLSAFAGGAVVQQRRKEFVENVEFTKKAMNETQATMSQSSTNFKVYTGLAIASFAVVAASQFGLLPSSFTTATNNVQVAEGSLSGMDYALFAVPVAAFGGGAFFKLRSDEVFQNLDATKKAMNQTQAMMIESQNRGKIFKGISAVSLSIAILSQLSSLEFVSFSPENPATYKLKETATTVVPYKSLDSLRPPEINAPSTIQSPPKSELSSVNENTQTVESDTKSNE